jgi:Transposase and inactivated derivatives
MRERSSINLQAFYPESLQIIKIEEESKQIKITMKSRKHSHNCPLCGQEAQIYHATYMRSVQDLPIFQKNVILHIKAYDYYCANEDCEGVSFAEDYEDFIGRSDRMTERLENFIQTLALETNCEGAAVICKELGIRTSGDTIIRILRKQADIPAAKCGEVIGVDDFAYRKGQTYCTVICDGKTRHPIDILDGRDGKSLKEWLANNKHIKKVTRDRAGAYAKAISEVLPDAMQIADRFHLHQNLSAAVKEALNGVISNEILVPNNISEFENNDSLGKRMKKTEEVVAGDKKN